MLAWEICENIRKNSSWVQSMWPPRTLYGSVLFGVHFQRLKNKGLLPKHLERNLVRDVLVER